MKRWKSLSALFGALVLAGCAGLHRLETGRERQAYAVLVPDHRNIMAQCEQSWVFDQDQPPVLLAFTVTSVER